MMADRVRSARDGMFERKGFLPGRPEAKRQFIGRASFYAGCGKLSPRLRQYQIANKFLCRFD